VRVELRESQWWRTLATGDEAQQLSLLPCIQRTHHLTVTTTATVDSLNKKG
jgi:hypothetical protein